MEDFGPKSYDLRDKLTECQQKIERLERVLGIALMHLSTHTIGVSGDFTGDIREYFSFGSSSLEEVQRFVDEEARNRNAMIKK